MFSDNFADSDLQYSEKFIPKVNTLTMIRLGLFNLGLGLMAVLTLAVLNRVMISELGIPASIAAGTLALSQLVAPTRVWFGQMSDAKPLFGLHRTNYVRLGIFLLGLAVFFAVQIVWILGNLIKTSGGWQWNIETIIWSILLGLIFIIYGLALGASSTPFTALLVDISDEDNRSKIVATVWSMLMVGIVIGGITGKKMLDKIEVSKDSNLPIPLENLQAPINSLFIVVPIIVLILAFIGTYGVEKKYSRYRMRSTVADREENITLGNALKILTASRQTGIFFSFLVMITLSLFMQEAVLEPYGGEVFGMTIGETTFLNSFWGMGILLGYGTTGFLVIPRLGKTQTTKIGCILVAVCFGLIILAGLTQEVAMLKAAIVLFGVAAGITTIGSISLMLDLTAAETAGTFVGAWGLAQSMSRGFGIGIGGWILDFGKAIFNNTWLAYSLVFACEALCIVGAIALLNQINIKEFQNDTKKATTIIMEGDI
jgi:BCD family chlorophyll transporter-like MFS transporter